MARRLGSTDSESRTALLDAAQALMLESGHAAVSSRKVAAAAGLKPQLVHYYFRTMDDLFLAMFQRSAEVGLERQRRTFDDDQPLWALWEYSNDRAGTRLSVEFMAMGNHRPAIRDEIAGWANRFRDEQVAALDTILAAHDIEIGALEVSVLMAAVSRFLSMEAAIGTEAGHAESRALVEDLLVRLEGPRRQQLAAG